MSKSDFTGPGIYLLQNASVTNLAVNLSNQGDQTAVVGWYNFHLLTPTDRHHWWRVLTLLA